ncbi:MAG TPA: GNAT family N-acetyltransferase [Gemmatimonadaceae bacterium]
MPLRTSKSEPKIMSISADVELLEAEAWAQMHAAWAAEAPGATTVKRWGRATGLLTPAVEAVAVNRVIGLGCEVPLDRQTLTEVRNFYRAAGRTRWFLDWSPDAQATEQDLLESAGGQLRNHQAKTFARIADTRPVADSGFVQVVKVSHETRASFRDLVAPLLGIPDAGHAGIIAPVGQTGWHYYFAVAGGKAIAGAAMFSDGHGAWFGLSATLPAHRNMGAQSALLSARIRDARALGCTWVSAETHPTSADTNPSLRNMARAGMHVLYHRPFYRFDEPAPSSP